MRSYARPFLPLLTFLLAAASSAQCLPLGVGVSGGLLAPVGDFGQDLGGGLNLALGLGVFPVERVKLSVEASYARLKGKGDADLRLQLMGGEVLGQYTVYAPTEDIGLYGLLGVGNSRFIRTLGSGEERGYQVNAVIGGGGSFRVHGKAYVDAGFRVRRYLSEKSGDAFLLQTGVWYGL